jgi:hypothetical protein
VTTSRLFRITVARIYLTSTISSTSTETLDGS